MVAYTLHSQQAMIERVQVMATCCFDTVTMGLLLVQGVRYNRTHAIIIVCRLSTTEAFILYTGAVTLRASLGNGRLDISYVLHTLKHTSVFAEPQETMR